MNLSRPKPSSCILFMIVLFYVSQYTQLDNLCPASERNTVHERKINLLQLTLTYRIAGLLPDTEYNVSVTAINNAGRGYPATVQTTTLEEGNFLPFSSCLPLKSFN